VLGPTVPLGTTGAQVGISAASTATTATATPATRPRSTGARLPILSQGAHGSPGSLGTTVGTVAVELHRALHARTRCA
jgi:hypothetical protein